MSQLPLEQTDPLLHKAIEIEKAKIKVLPYYDTVVRKSWAGRSQGLYAGATLGLALGLLIGALSLYVVPTLLGVSMVAGAMPLVQFAAVGAGVGMLIGTSIGPVAGAVAAAAEERERREKAQGLEAQILASPELQQQLRDRYIASGMPTADLPVNTFRELVDHSRSKREIWQGLFKPKVMLACGLLAAALGAIFGVEGSIPLLKVAGTSLSQQVAYSAAVFGMIGALFGINVGAIYTSFTKLGGDLLSGRLFEKNGIKQKEQALAEHLETELALPPISKLEGSRLEELRARGYTPSTPAAGEHSQPGRPTPAQIHDAVYIERLEAEMQRGTPT